jgi:phosphopantothenoylcysteine synthetase/decarboxylase
MKNEESIKSNKNYTEDEINKMASKEYQAYQDFCNKLNPEGEKNMKNVLLGVTGGIAAYKACDLINGLKANGYDVRVIMTEHAKEFIAPMTLATLSTHPVMDNMWAEKNGNVEHIDTAKWAEIFVVYPATANIIAKFANGIADDLLSTVYLALPQKVVKIVFLAMNTNMLQHPSTQRNMIQLKKDDVYVSETRNAMLACGDVGKGAVLKPRDAINYINEMIDRKNLMYERKNP